MKKPWTDRFGDFMAGRGFYIVLFLCVAAIGASGYYLFSSLAGDGEGTAVSGPAQVIATPPVVASPAPGVSSAPSPAPTPVKPSPTPSPRPSASPSQAPANPPSNPNANSNANNPNSNSNSNSNSQSTMAAPTVFTWPVKGQVVDAFSPDHQRYDVTMEDWRTHAGVDISADVGTPVKAAAKGTVASVTVDDLLGTTVTIDHGDGLKSVYANLSETPTVKEGDGVSAGDIIGAVGSTAKGESAQVSHLHFAFFKNDAPADPLKYLPSLS